MEEVFAYLATGAIILWTIGGTVLSIMAIEPLRIWQERSLSIRILAGIGGFVFAVLGITIFLWPTIGNGG